MELVLLIIVSITLILTLLSFLKAYYIITDMEDGKDYPVAMNIFTLVKFYYEKPCNVKRISRKEYYKLMK